MRGDWDAVVQQTGGASPVVNQYTFDTTLREGLTPEQLEEQQTATVQHIDESSAAIPPSSADASPTSDADSLPTDFSPPDLIVAPSPDTGNNP